MKHSFALILIALCATFNLSAQSTSPAEESKSLSDAKQRVVVRYEQKVASVNSGSGLMSFPAIDVLAAEFVSIGDDSREYKVLIDITQMITTSSTRQSRVSIPHEELETLISAFSVLQNIDRSNSTLPNYAAFYRTKGDFSIRVFFTGRVPTYEVEDTSVGGVGTSLSQANFAQLATALQSAKDILDRISANE
jgi:hypothetical protein